MKRTTLAWAISTVFLGCAGTALAQSNSQPNFVGPAIGLGVSAVQNKVDFASAVASIDGQSSQANDAEAALIASYGFAMSPDWVGTAGISYGLKSSNAGSITYTAGGTQTVTAKLKDHLVLSFAPGYRMAPDTLVYAKLAYHQIKVDYTDTATTGGTTSHAGTGFGLGIAYALDPKLELRAEYESVTYSEDKAQLTSGKPRQSGLTLGLLYRF